ncbi:coiled-coil domain-containing protein 81-like [Chiroxiphia lanceolata]|uniref:coiled-coil domain-containing protein 81-like n=1 Tax=Chiroxiphia lanceolata TaxID=296741 RepID=UPI0013CE989F|nr:coiled-coil domain-containing protein 81-like [Chiroxiphia lanceolata]
MAVATQDQTGNVSQTKMDFWDGMESVFMMPNITPTERRAVWSAVSRYVQRQLLQHKGVRVPTLGSFDVVHTETPVGDRTVTLQRPMFYLARNLGGVSNLMDNNIDLTGDKPLEPLKYAEVAVEASVSRRKAESCILGTTSLLYHCLAKGESAAFILRDVGVLLIEGRRAHMRFYPDFLEKMTGKNIQDRATLKVLQQLDLVVSREVPVASLAFTSRILIFPEFEPASLPLSLLRDHLRAWRDVPGGDKGKQTKSLPPVGRGTEGRFPGLAVPSGSTTKADKQPWHEGDEEMKDSSGVRMWPQTPPSLLCPSRKLPVIPGAAAAGKKQSGTDQAKGKPTPKGQGVSVVLAPGPEPAQGLRPRPEAFWSVLKEPQKSILAGYRFEPSLFVPPLLPEGPPALRSPVLKKTEVVARGLWPWME